MDKRTFRLELRPHIPQPLRRLEELAGNLAYSWDREFRDLFWRLDRQLFNACGKNPKLFLRRVPQAVLDQAAGDRDFLEDYSKALSSFDSYMASGPGPGVDQALGGGLIAYFCAEYGIHESLPIYSGGLGVLAGDHCKAASDLGLPFVAVGLLYRQGYFRQTIDGAGVQHAHPHRSDFDELPVQPCRGPDGSELRVAVEIADRTVRLRIWQALVGRVSLYLLDSDVPENGEAERLITHQLYGGDAELRIRQEIVLGVGGLRVLRALGLQPAVFHMNEGHAAFLVLERIREQVAAGAGFPAALELVAAGHVFTTHTPVPAGHDRFSPSQLRWHLQALLPQLGCSEEQALALGGADGSADAQFNMTTLALRASRFHNGVSAIHGGVARRMEQSLWPQVPAEENPISHVTNGVHLHTFLAHGWNRLFHDSFRGWRNELLNPAYWSCIDSIPHQRFVSVRQQLKRELLLDVNERIQRQLRRNGQSEALIERVTEQVAVADPRTLVIGFARRFASYKRATLVLTDEARLARILNRPQQPALMIFAGKAHPRDEPGQAIIRKLYEASMKPEFLGRLIVLEGYDLLLARNLVQGCDVWLNNPEYPLEASGTSGQKAGINGVVNVSVLDGWWGEAYDGGNGYAVRPVDPQQRAGDEAALDYRDREECRQLLDILEQRVLPTYFGTDNQGFAPDWVHICRESMKTLIPRYNSARMVMDYVRGSYAPAARQSRRFAADDGAEAAALAEWKRRVRARWAGVHLELAEPPGASLYQGDRLSLEVLAHLSGLDASDLVVECLLWPGEAEEIEGAHVALPLAPEGAAENGRQRFKLELAPLPGLQHYRIRVRPAHAALSHPLEMGLLTWL